MPLFPLFLPFASILGVLGLVVCRFVLGFVVNQQLQMQGTELCGSRNPFQFQALKKFALDMLNIS